MITKRLLLIVALVALMSTMSLAQKFEITPFGGYRTSGSFKLAPNVLNYSNLKITDELQQFEDHGRFCLWSVTRIQGE